jgi:hypothetical protein
MLRLTAALLATLAVTQALAATPEDISEGAPLTVDDTTVTGKGKRTAQLSAAGERTAAGDYRVRLEPQLKAGIAEGWQASVSVPVIGGSASRATSGDIRVGVQGKFNEESGWLPSIGASLRLALPTGRDTEGLDTRIKLLATKTFAQRHRVHLNALFENNQDPRPNERSNRRGLVVGYDMKLREGTLLLADYVVEHARERGRHDRLLEAGLRQKVGEGVLGFGIGAGVGDSATDWRLRLSWQQGF